MFPSLTLLQPPNSGGLDVLEDGSELDCLAAMAEDIVDFNDCIHVGHRVKVVIKPCSHHIYVNPCFSTWNAKGLFAASATSTCFLATLCRNTVCRYPSSSGLYLHLVSNSWGHTFGATKKNLNGLL